MLMPRYPVYVPSKGRYESGYTIRFLIADQVPFYIVVEPQEADEYGQRYGYERLLILPWSGNDAVRQAYTEARGIENGGLIAVRNFIMEHSIGLGALRHWQLDDNIHRMKRRYKTRRIPCAAGAAMHIVEEFTDRYSNIAISGMNYNMFAYDITAKDGIPPFHLNCRVYSCSLINNAIPYRWRIAYNDDVDICLQALAGGWCTVLVNAFLIEKIKTMVVTGGNTTDLYQGDGRLKMARSLQRLWPGVVETRRRFNRPQHVVKDAWRRFDTPLQLRPGVTIPPGANEFGLQLQAMAEVKSPRLREMLHASTTTEERSPAGGAEGRSASAGGAEDRDPEATQ